METLAISQSRREMNVPPSALSVITLFQKTAPIDVNGLAKELGLAVYEDPGMPSEWSGRILKDAKHGGHCGYSIIVNAHEALVRKRFTVAHEIAHYLLHRNSIGDGLVDDGLYRSGLPTLQEVHANRLAADILMPYSRIEDAIRGGAKTIDALAKIFKVSPQAMSLRLGVPG
ncbi:MAG TPA: ImmA/IrrE family metallo-endopeptidase [Acidobacteriaceae bacterium]|jgi:Zn-dependent peptidase ImmA (M78 family)|nr:ImmA/IrrE family metallo-endopeptidase [Acidobacteriaceae bacterium]